MRLNFCLLLGLLSGALIRNKGASCLDLLAEKKETHSDDRNIRSVEQPDTGLNEFNEIQQTPLSKQAARDASMRVAAGYLFADTTDAHLNLSDPVDSRLLELLERDGPDMRPSRDYKDFSDITMDVARRAWILFHHHATRAAFERAQLVQPIISEFLTDARASQECKKSIDSLLDGAKRLESWAIKMVNSWGSFPPIGIFEGTYSEVGSYHTCVNIPENKFIGHAHYCSITFRPVMPSRKSYELVVRKEPDELLHLFNRKPSQSNGTNVMGQNSSDIPRDSFQDLLEHAQYHHYVYYKWGTCWPIHCSPFDVRRMAKLMAKRNILMNGPVKCYSKFSEDYEEAGSVELAPRNSTGGNMTEPVKRKLEISVWDKNKGIFIWKPHFNKTQWAALAVVLTSSVVVLVMTIIDLALVRLPKLYKQVMLAMDTKTIDNTNGQIDRPLNSSDKIHASSLNKSDSCGRPDELMLEQQEQPLKGGPECIATTDSSNLEANKEYANRFSQKLHRSGGDKSTFMNLADDCSLVTNVNLFLEVSEEQMRKITCLDGIRCMTMIWIIMTHTMMYNDWSAFARTRDIELSLKSLIAQPLFNGSYLVDTFFLASGLVSAYTTFKHCKGMASKFSSFSYIFSRWLRLTPQIFFTSMLYIILPVIYHGPHWYPIAAEYSENCSENWWINVLHLQAFYKTEKMCNFVTWWISIDFLYYFFALAIIWVILLGGHKFGFYSTFVLTMSQVAWQIVRHYQQALPPNVFSTIPQTGAMWTQMTLGFFWTPYTHAVPFFMGFYVGYLLSMKSKLITRFLNTKRALIGWTICITLFVGQSYSTYWWIIGEASYSKLVSTIFYTICSFVWSGSLCWIVVACHHGYGGFINQFLSMRIFVITVRASYMIYLSHFQILFLFFGSQNLLLEPTPLTMLYFILGNIFLATLLGIFLCIVYEYPWLKLQQRLF